MAAINRVILIGNLGKKPELKHTGSNKAVCSFSIAVNEKKDGPPLWVQIVTWEKTAEACARFLDKGSSIYVEGRLAMREHEKDGQKRQYWEVVAHQVQFLDGKDKSSDEGRGRGGDKGDYGSRRQEPEQQDFDEDFR
jgi:single-strand DNA-binding protein